MKLIIQIPCLNEEATITKTLQDLPHAIAGVDQIETLIVDDGSSDHTVEVVREFGVNHIVRHTQNKGLAEAFMTGIDACLKLGADIIVNTDGDNQYCGKNIADLIKPILQKEADMVIGDRQTDGIHHFSYVKKRLQAVGSWVVRHVSDTNVPDAPSGFRAFSREAALRMNVISRFSYTLETIIQAGKKNLAVTSIPVETNQKLRESRLFSSLPKYLKRSISTIFRIYTMYEPLKMFSIIGGLIFSGGLLLSFRFLYFYITGNESGHVQSLILSAVLMMIGFQVIMIGLVADLIGGLRRLVEDTLFRVKKLEMRSQSSQQGNEDKLSKNKKKYLKRITDLP
ncbi:MAG: glycosyltransferase family 2 protein [bacterium]